MMIRQLNLAVTSRCNARCMHCKIWMQEAEQDFTCEQLLGMMRISKDLRHLRTVRITGGEPFLKGNLFDVCSGLLCLYPQVHLSISTNGLLPERIEQAVKDFVRHRIVRALTVVVSVDGKAATHDTIRGVRGAYRCALDTIELLKKYKVKTVVSFTITPANTHELEAVCRLACTLGVGFVTRWAQKSFFYHNRDAQFALSDLDNLHRRLKHVIALTYRPYSLVARYIHPYAYFMSNITRHLQHPQRSHRCYSGLSSAFMSARGDVYPCIMLDQKIGNILEEPFDQIWRSSRAAAIRDFITDKKNCSCWTECETIHSVCAGGFPYLPSFHR